MALSNLEKAEQDPLLTFYQHVLAAYRIFPKVKHHMPSKACDYLGELLIAAQQELVRCLEPVSPEQVRTFEQSLQAPALVFLLSTYQKCWAEDHDLHNEISRWSDYLWQKADEQALLPLLDTNIKTVEDLVCWFQCHGQLLEAL